MSNAPTDGETRPYSRETYPQDKRDKRRRILGLDPSEICVESDCSDGCTGDLDTDAKPRSITLVGYSELLQAHLNIMIVETEHGRLANLTHFLHLNDPYWDGERHMEQLSKLRILVPSMTNDDRRGTWMYFGQFLDRFPGLLSLMVLEALRTGDYSAFPGDWIHQVGERVYRDPRNHNRVISTPASPLFSNPTTLERYEIEEGWINPGNTPPMEEDAQAHATLRPISSSSNLRSALRHRRFIDRCERYRDWMNGVHDRMEKLCPMNRIIVALAEEVLSKTEEAPGNTCQRSRRSEDAIMRAAICISAIHLWMWGDRMQALGLHTEVATRYRSIDGKRISLKFRSYLKASVRRPTQETDDMYGDTKLARRDYASSYVQGIQHAITALGLLPSDNNETTISLQRMQGLSHHSLSKLVKLLYRACHTPQDERRHLAISEMWHSLNREHHLHRCPPIFDHFYIGPPHKVWFALQRPNPGAGPFSLLSFPSIDDPDHPVLKRGAVGTMIHAPIYLFSMDGTFDATCSTWSADDVNSEFFRTFTGHRIQYMGQMLRRIPTIPYGSIASDPERCVRFTHDGHPSYVRDWPHDFEPWNDTNRHLPRPMCGPLIDEPFTDDLNKPLYSRLGATIDTLTYACYHLPDYTRTKDDYPISPNVTQGVIPNELAIDIGLRRDPNQRTFER